MELDRKKFDIALAKSCLSATELSEISNVDVVTISRAKNGKQEPRPQTIGRIAKALNVTVEEIIKEDKV